MCDEDHISYQLLIRVEKPVRLRVGALGRHRFFPGFYLYTGSARRNLGARIRRHLDRDKRCRWHIDYLLTAPGVRVEAVFTSSRPECEWNASVEGTVPVPGFGASDCRRGCGAHLLRLADRQARHLLEAAGLPGAGGTSMLVEKER